ADRVTETLKQRSHRGAFEERGYEGVSYPARQRPLDVGGEILGGRRRESTGDCTLQAPLRNPQEFLDARLQIGAPSAFKLANERVDLLDRVLQLADARAAARRVPKLNPARFQIRDLLQGRASRRL